MGNFKKVKLYIESTGYMYTTDENNIEGWEDGILDENEYRVTKVEVIEEYNLSEKQIEYIKNDDYEPEMVEGIDAEILRQSRTKKINLYL